MAGLERAAVSPARAELVQAGARVRGCAGSTSELVRIAPPALALVRVAPQCSGRVDSPAGPGGDAEAGMLGLVNK